MFFNQQHLAKILPQSIPDANTVHCWRCRSRLVSPHSHLNQGLQLRTGRQMTDIAQLLAWKSFEGLPNSSHFRCRVQLVARVLLRMQDLGCLPRLQVEGITTRVGCLRMLIGFIGGRWRRQQAR